MKTLVQRWGNGMVLRIPKTFAVKISLSEGDAVEMTVVKGRLIVSPRIARDYQLADLVGGIRSNNIHKEIVEGRRGREIW